MEEREKFEYREVVELKGHIIDSLTLSKLFDEIIARGGNYTSEEITIGMTKADQSYARVSVEARDKATLDNILIRLSELGAVSTEKREVTLAEAPAHGVFPEGFYSTTNLETEIYTKGEWIKVEGISMDSGVGVEGARASAVKMKDVKSGESFVVGSGGVRVSMPDKTAAGRAFKFMSSGVSSEKPIVSLIGALAEEILELRAADASAKILFVCGPAIVHTGAREHLCRLIERGYVDALFAGNALATHDIEASLYGTSLGVYLKSGEGVFEGHNHHLRAINTIRGAGGIKAAVESGLLKDGIMYSCVTHGTDLLLAGSIRDDGPLPEVITDVLEAQTKMREKLKGVRFAIMISTMLHSIAVGNLLPASVRTICVDIDPVTVTKLSDRGTHQATGLVIDAGTFLRELSERLPPKGRFSSTRLVVGGELTPLYAACFCAANPASHPVQETYGGQCPPYKAMRVKHLSGPLGGLPKKLTPPKRRKLNPPLGGRSLGAGCFR